MIKYIDNYWDKSGSLWQFKRDKHPINYAGNPVSVSTNNSLLFKCKWNVLEKPDAVDGNGVLHKWKITVQQKYLSNCYKSFDITKQLKKDSKDLCIGMSPRQKWIQQI